MSQPERHSLVRIIGRDLIRVGKWPLLCFLLVLASALLVVLTTHQTRLQIAKRERLVLEREAMEIEWRNLTLEENVLGDHSRVERIAQEKLHMQHVSTAQENIVIEQ